MGRRPKQVLLAPNRGNPEDSFETFDLVCQICGSVIPAEQPHAHVRFSAELLAELPGIERLQWIFICICCRGRVLKWVKVLPQYSKLDMIGKINLLHDILASPLSMHWIPGLSNHPNARKIRVQSGTQLLMLQSTSTPTGAETGDGPDRPPFLEGQPP